jgi:hypothetical protein
LFFAAVIGGVAFEFPVVLGAWVAVADDHSGLAVEVYPLDMAHHPGVGDADPAVQPNGPSTLPWEDQIYPETAHTRPTGFHVAIATRLKEAEIIARARAAGWRALACDRAGVFKLVEVWVDNGFLVEVLVPEEVERYRAFMNPEGCRPMFGESISPELST